MSKLFTYFVYSCYSFIIALILFNSISRFVNVPVYVDDEIKPFFKEFQVDAKRFKVDVRYNTLIIMFSETLEENLAGYCRPGTRTIVISRQVWNNQTYWGKKALIYHELGHCLLRRDHTEDFFIGPMVCPASLMFPAVRPTDQCFPHLQNEYLTDLFLNPYKYPTF